MDTIEKLRKEEQERAVELSNCINAIPAGNLVEMKNQKNPPTLIKKLATAMLHIFGKQVEKGYEWQDYLKLMGQKRAFYDAVSKGPHDCPPRALEKLAPIVNDRDFTAESMMKVSRAGTELVSYVCAWYEWQLVKTKIEKMQRVYDVDQTLHMNPRTPQTFAQTTYTYRKHIEAKAVPTKNMSPARSPRRAKPRVATARKIQTNHHQINLDDCCKKVSIEMEDLPPSLREQVQQLIDYKVEQERK